MIKTLEVGKMIKSIKSMKVKKRKRTHEHNLNNLSYDPYGEVPTLVTLSIDWLLENAIDSEGLFRVSGAFHEVQQTKSKMLQGKYVNLDELNNPNLVAGVLKMFLVEMPDPLLTFDLYDDFIDAQLIKNVEQRLSSISSVISNLPKANREILKRLAFLLSKINENSKQNKMTSNNLSIVFAPTLLRCRDNDLIKLLAHSQVANDLIGSFILEYNALFESSTLHETPTCNDTASPSSKQSKPDAAGTAWSTSQSPKGCGRKQYFRRTMSKHRRCAMGELSGHRAAATSSTEQLEEAQVSGSGTRSPSDQNLQASPEAQSTQAALPESSGVQTATVEDAAIREESVAVQEALAPTTAVGDAAKKEGSVAVQEALDQVKLELGKVKVCEEEGLIHEFIEYDDGSIYSGQTKDGEWHGQGTLFFCDGNVYRGQFQHGELTGVGTLIYAMGDKYEGQFVKGVRHGRGIYTAAVGDRYVGTYRNGKRNGYGVYSMSDGTIYDGHYLDELRHGQGKLISSNGDTYEGGFKDDKYHGHGVYCSTSGGSYSGEFQDGLKHGFGKYISPSRESQYEGEWLDDLMHGKGAQVTPKGEYKGEFVKGKYHGEGVYTLANSKGVIHALFQDGKPVKKL